jgi:hypothetical protein
MSFTIGGDKDNLTPLLTVFPIHGCYKASDALILSSGSNSKHALMKSMNISSSPLIRDTNYLLLGTLLTPFTFSKIGAPCTSKYVLLRFDLSIILFGGIPITCMISSNCSYSCFPGKSGFPVNSSARIQPRLQMSTLSV